MLKDETFAESKLKSRMTILNVHNANQTVRKQTQKKNRLKISQTDDYIIKFIQNEMEFYKCIDYLADFEVVLLDSKKSSSTQVFSKSTYSKINLNFVTLKNNYYECAKILCNIMNSKSNNTTFHDIMIDYFDKILLFINEYKILAQNIDKILYVLMKSSSKLKKIYPKPLTVSFISKPINIEKCVEIIYNNVENYIRFLNGLILINNFSKNIHDKFVLFCNELIIINDIMLLSRIGKKNYKNGRLMNFCAPVVELCANYKQKYCLLFLFMDCLVVTYQSIKNPDDMIVKHIFSLKKCECSRSFQQNITLNPNHDQECKYKKGKIAATYDTLFQLKSNAKVANSKIEKLQKQLNHDKYELSLLLRKYPLTITFNQKTTMTFLFETELEAFNWEYIINHRANHQLMDDTTATNNELQSIINEYMKQTLSGTNFQEKSRFLEEALVPDEMEFHEEICTDEHKYLNNHYLIIKVIFKRFNTPNKDIYFNIQCDHYNNFFRKFKSPIMKQNEVFSEMITILTERTKCIRFEINKIKNKAEPEVSKSFDLVKLGILEKSFITFRYKYNNCGIFTVYAESFQKDLFEKNCPISAISLINHFQPSIELISQSENRPLPLVVQICIEKIESYGLEDVGIYRISGTAIKIVQLEKRFAENQISHVDDLDEYDLHDATGLLKYFFRELKHRLVPSEIVPEFEKWNADETKNIESLHDCISLLPQENQNTFYFLLNHLIKISKLSDINKMTHANLSTVFGPNIFGVSESDSSQQNILSHVTIFKSILDIFELK